MTENRWQKIRWKSRKLFGFFQHVCSTALIYVDILACPPPYSTMRGCYFACSSSSTFSGGIVTQSWLFLRAQELQQKREEKRQASQQRAPPGGGGDGLCYLQPGGALTRTPAGATAAAAAAGKSNVRRRTAKTTSTPTDAVASGDEGGSGRPSGGASVTGGGDATGRVTARQVDDLFQVSHRRRQSGHYNASYLITLKMVSLFWHSCITISIGYSKK